MWINDLLSVPSEKQPNDQWTKCLRIGINGIHPVEVLQNERLSSVHRCLMTGKNELQSIERSEEVNP